jgi:hypothetical protein
MEAIAFYDMNPWPIRSNYLPRQKKPKKLHGYRVEVTLKLNVCEVASESLPLKFKRLLAEWRKETAHLSSIQAKVMVTSYLEIIGMGQPALRLILNELKERPTYLFPALRAITGIDPVQPGDKGKLRRMANTWIEWGRQNNIVE